MFVKKAIIAVASLFALATAAPTASEPELSEYMQITKIGLDFSQCRLSGARTTGVQFQSFNNFLGFQNLANFDNFFGVNNFNGFLNQQVVVRQDTLVCSSLPVNIVQQRLFILQELAKQ